MNIRHWSGLLMIIGGGALAKVGSVLLKPTLEAYKETITNDLKSRIEKKEVDE